MDHSSLLASLRSIVGHRNMLTGAGRLRPYVNGYRFGGGPAVAVVTPGSLVEQWRVLLACVAADLIVITQAANTGLTGGSTPDGVYDRGVVIVSTRRITGVHLIRDGQQAVCLAGSTLYALERALRPLGREPHSVIGSSCIGASVVGGVCNNSGGSLVQRGPAYTEYALFAAVDLAGKVTLRNRLGIALPDDPEAALAAVERGDFAADTVHDDGRRAAANDYDGIVRAVDSDTPARFNADPARLFEAAGSAGRIMVFAVRLDTFEQAAASVTFYIGTNDPGTLTQLRRSMLTSSQPLPIAGEYIHRDAFDIAERYGKDVFLAIRHFGTDRLPWFFAIKGWVDAFVARTRVLPPAISDHLLQAASRLFPSHLPARMRRFRNRFAHHLILKVGAGAAVATRALLSALLDGHDGDVFECSASEAEAAFLHRFAVAGAAVRYRAVHSRQVEDIIALDIALRRNDADWVERLPDDIARPVLHALYYGHFFCHVFHQDYLVARGTDATALEHRLWQLLDARGARYPAEHNVGHLYPAPAELADHYRALDPRNVMNPGIGKTSKRRMWA